MTPFTLLLAFFVVALSLVSAMSDDEIDALCTQRDDVHCKWRGSRLINAIAYLQPLAVY